MNVATLISESLRQNSDIKQAKHLSRFFKTEKGSYGYGDKFLGIKVPVTRGLIKQYKKDATLEDVEALTNSEWHEERLAGLLLLLEIYKKRVKNGGDAFECVDFYLARLKRGNNWDLVDLIAPGILGDWLVGHADDLHILDDLASDENLWHKRVAIVATMALIKAGIYEPTERVVVRLINHPHDLIHKASGWMLREIGKRDEARLCRFLDSYGAMLPRTALRYAIERFEETRRQYYLRSTI